MILDIYKNKMNKFKYLFLVNIMIASIQSGIIDEAKIYLNNLNYLDE